MAKTSMLQREIDAQPRVLAAMIAREASRVRRLAAAVRRFNPRCVVIVGRGSADNAGLYGKYLFGARNGLIVSLATPSLVTRYRAYPSFAGTLVLGISQSGQSYDVVETVARARHAGAMTVALTNSPRSPLAQAAEHLLPSQVGTERSVAATKTYTAQLPQLALLSAALRERPSELAQIAQVPTWIAEALETKAHVREVAERLLYLEQCEVIGRGYTYGTAFELALKLSELTHIVAQPHSSADFRHGPIAVVKQGFCVVLLAPQGKVIPDISALLDELRARKAVIIAISDVAALRRRATWSFALPRGVPEWLAPLTCIVPGQLLAMELCAVKGLSLDHPHGLHKVTRTR